MSGSAMTPYDPPNQGGLTEVTELDIEVVMERRYRILGGPAKTASFAAATWGGWLVGWSMRESSGSAAAVVKLHSGGSTDGQLVLSVALASAASDHEWLGDRGVDVQGGFYVEIVSGQADVILYARPSRTDVS